MIATPLQRSIVNGQESSNSETSIIHPNKWPTVARSLAIGTLMLPATEYTVTAHAYDFSSGLRHCFSEDLDDSNSTLLSLLQLPKGWDGYHAPPPSRLSVARATSFLNFLRRNNIADESIAGPSVVGGVGFTFYSDEDRGNIEFDNEDDVTIVFSRLQSGDRHYSVEEIDWNDANPEESALEAWQVINGTLYG